jgi:hypothetical protein
MDMEIKNNETQRLDLVPRTVAFGLAVATTTFIATSVAVVFTGATHSVGTSLVQAALAPLRAVFGS